MASQDLLVDDDVRRWYENLARASEQTAIERLRVLARYCRMRKTTPREIVVVARRRGNSFEDDLQDFLQEQRDAGRVPSYLANYLKTLRSWLDHHGLSLGRRINVGKTRATPTIQDEQVPTKQQLRDVLMAATPRNRAIISLVAFSGLRLHVLGNFRGLDGLRLKDLPDLQTEGEAPRFVRVPAIVRVRPELSKVAHEYFSFLGEEGCEHLLRYLQERASSGDRLETESPVIRTAPGYERHGRRRDAANHGSPFIVAGNIRWAIKNAMQKARLESRPYVLRRYFETQLINASWKGIVPRDWVTFWAGHQGDIEHVYTLHKGIPAGLVEDMRASYARAEPYLSTVSYEMDLGTLPEEAAALEVRLDQVERLTGNLLTILEYQAERDADLKGFVEVAKSAFEKAGRAPWMVEKWMARRGGRKERD